MATTERGSANWERSYAGSPERNDELFSTISGVENEPLYTPENVGVDYNRDLGYPGQAPFTRGVYPSMYRGRLWTMRQFAGFGTAEETNARFRYLLDHATEDANLMPLIVDAARDYVTLGEMCDALREVGRVARAARLLT